MPRKWRKRRGHESKRARLENKLLPCDLVELNMVDFDVILWMDWLHAYYASIDYRTCKVKF